MGLSLCLEGLCHTYSSGVVIELTSLQLAGGKPAALTGVSGSGKSTLLECIGLLKPCQCERYLLGGFDVQNLHSERERALFRQGHIGFMPQSGGLIDFLSVRDNLRLQLELALKARGEGGNKGQYRQLFEEACALAADLGIGSLLSQYPHQLSIGQRQRAVFCRALAAKPDLLLIDEPTAALDPANAHLLFALIAQVCRKSGCCALVITHDEQSAAQFATRCALNGMLSQLRTQQAAAAGQSLNFNVFAPLPAAQREQLHEISEMTAAVTQCPVAVSGEDR